VPQDTDLLAGLTAAVSGLATGLPRGIEAGHRARLGEQAFLQQAEASRQGGLLNALNALRQREQDQARAEAEQQRAYLRSLTFQRSNLSELEKDYTKEADFAQRDISALDMEIAKSFDPEQKASLSNYRQTLEQRRQGALESAKKARVLTERIEQVKDPGARGSILAAISDLQLLPIEQVGTLGPLGTPRMQRTLEKGALETIAKQHGLTDKASLGILKDFATLMAERGELSPPFVEPPIQRPAQTLPPAIEAPAPMRVNTEKEFLDLVRPRAEEAGRLALGAAGKLPVRGREQALAPVRKAIEDTFLSNLENIPRTSAIRGKRGEIPGALRKLIDDTTDDIFRGLSQAPAAVTPGPLKPQELSLKLPTAGRQFVQSLPEAPTLSDFEQDFLADNFDLLTEEA
jgi:hypothetical protein